MGPTAHHPPIRRQTYEHTHRAVKRRHLCSVQHAGVTRRPTEPSSTGNTPPLSSSTRPSECPHSVCSHTLIVTYVTFAPEVTVASLLSIPRHGAHPKETMGLYSSETSREMRPRHFRGPLDCDWERLRFHNERTSRTQRGGMRRARL